MESLISVIVPVYKVEKYICRCLDSVINQSYRNLEIILVDDGSPDRCGMICDEYSKKDDRIKVIHKENGGLSDARNVALDVAKGDYVSFVDSDDYVSSEYIKQLYYLVDKYESDISVINYEKVYENSGIACSKTSRTEGKIYILDRMQAVKTMLYQEKFDSNAWGKLFKVALFKEIRFPKGRIFEDLAIMYKIFINAKRTIYMDEIHYYYLVRTDSIDHAVYTPKKLDMYYALSEMMDVIKKNDFELFEAALSRYVSGVFHIWIQMPMNSKEYKEAIGKIKKVRKRVLFNGRARRKARLACLLTYGSFRITRIIFKAIKPSMK